MIPSVHVCLLRILCSNTFSIMLEVTHNMSPPSSSMAVKHGPCLLTVKKNIQAFETKCMRKVLRLFYLEHKTNDCVRSKIKFLVGPQEPLLATAKRRKLALFGHVTRHASLSKSSFRSPWRVGDAVSAEEMLDGKYQRADIPAYARTAHKDLLQKKIGRGPLLNRPSWSPDDRIGQRTELN